MPGNYSGLDFEASTITVVLNNVRTWDLFKLFFFVKIWNTNQQTRKFHGLQKSEELEYIQTFTINLNLYLYLYDWGCVHIMNNSGSFGSLWQ